MLSQCVLHGDRAVLVLGVGRCWCGCGSRVVLVVRDMVVLGDGSRVVLVLLLGVG